MKRWSQTGTRYGLFAMVLLGAEAPASAEKPIARFAVVIGYNDLPSQGVQETGLRRLQFADDDALRFARLFRRAGVRNWILTDLDAQTEARLRETDEAPVIVRHPSRAALRSVMAEVVQRMNGAEAQGREVHLFLTYSGHGAHRPNGQVVYAFPDGDIDRTFLFDQLLVQTSTSALVHLIVDACYAAGFVGVRGSAADTSEDDYARLSRQFQTRPRVGALLASSANEEAQEWRGVSAGIFTYEVVSGLLGPADADGDGRIMYEELEAFIDAANSRLSDAERRRFVSLRPKEPRNVTLLDWRSSRSPGVQGDASSFGRFRVSIPGGVDWADAHGQAGHAMFIALPENGAVLKKLRPAHPEDEQVALRPAATMHRFEALALGRRKEAGTSDRGTDTELQQKLFGEPFGAAFLAGYRQGRFRGRIEGERETRLFVQEERNPWPGYTLVTVGGASLVAAGVTLGLGMDARSTYLDADAMSEADDAQRRSEGLLMASAVSGAVGVLAATLGILLWE